MIKGQYERAVSVAILPGQMEAREHMDEGEREMVRDIMRQTYAVHYTELFPESEPAPDGGEHPKPDDDADTGEPMKW